MSRLQPLSRFAFALIALALAVRALIPAGWMPSGEQAFAVTICTGIDTQTVWMDRSGGIHKTDPSKPEHKDEAAKEGCAFAGLGLPMLAISAAPYLANIAGDDASAPFGHHEIAIGQGLAAPPPPSTGPPTLI